MPLHSFRFAFGLSTLGACVVVLSLQIQPIAAQSQKKQAEETLRIRTELVQIDVAVKDQKGALVRDLKREDFEVLEDGKPQQVTQFAIGSANLPTPYLNSRRAGEPSPVATQAPAKLAPQGRYIVLAVDDFHLVAEDLFAVKHSLSQFIEND